MSFILFFISVRKGNFLKKSPLDLSLASKTYGQRTTPTGTFLMKCACKIWEVYQPPWFPATCLLQWYPESYRISQSEGTQRHEHYQSPLLQSQKSQVVVHLQSWSGMWGVLHGEYQNIYHIMIELIKQREDLKRAYLWCRSTPCTPSFILAE